LIPLIPLGYLVFSLVNQSYRMGVNTEVENALKNGFTFSRSVYKLQRNQLVLSLENFYLSDYFSVEPEYSPAAITHEKIAIDTAYWKIKSISFYDSKYELIWSRAFNRDQAESINQGIFKQFQSPRQRSLIISDRRNNHFTALLKIKENNYFAGFLVMQAGLNKNFLLQTNHSLKIHQMYQALNLNRNYLPHRFLYAFIVLAVILFSLVIATGIWISSLITKPLTLLAKGTEEIGRGNLEHRLTIYNRKKRKDEVGKLAEHFNDMVQKLKENQERIIHFEKMAAWKQMAHKLAHEIKNPLTPIQLTIQQLLDKYDNSDPQYQKLLEECYNIINEEIASLRNLVTEFSNLGKLPELNLENGDICSLIKEIKVMYQERIEFIPAENNKKFPFDSDRIRRVLINLIENAVQADPDGNPVIVSTVFESSKMKLIVEDKGKGIPEDNLNKIFEPHFTTKKEGMGLGLAITRLIIEEHRGSIKAFSEKDKGTKFEIELPCE
ncbi:MAG: HAMP domain-containing protein, partial [Calditrichia bacterium]|nr:HAMP domain-containing protein [Calditrichia bacterium]